MSFDPIKREYLIDLCCHQTYLMLRLETMLVSVIRVATCCYEQGSFFCRAINNWRLIKENETLWGLLCQCLPPPPQKETVQTRAMEEMQKYSSSQLMASVGGWAVEGLKELATESLTMFQWVYGQQKLDFVGFLRGVYKAGRVDLGGMGSRYFNTFENIRLAESRKTLGHREDTLL